MLSLKAKDVVEWMNLPNPGLKNYTPLELSSNITGHEEIMNLLNKMEWVIVLIKPAFN